MVVFISIVFLAHTSRCRLKLPVAVFKLAATSVSFEMPVLQILELLFQGLFNPAVVQGSVSLLVSPQS